MRLDLCTQSHLPRKLSLYIQISNIYLGLGLEFEFEFGPQRIRDLISVCSQSLSTAIKKVCLNSILLIDIYTYFFSSPLLRRILTADYSHDLHNTATRSNSETSLVSSTLGSNQLCSDLFNDDTECLIPSENNSPRHRQLRLERVIVSSDFILIGFLIARSIQQICCCCCQRFENKKVGFIR